MIIYTDGGCYNNPPNKGIGAFAYIIRTDDPIAHIIGCKISGSTNNRTEMMAILLALEDHPQDSLFIYTDSGYCVNGLYKYLDNWISNGYITSSKEPVKNQDLWNIFSIVRWHRRFKLHLIRGHNKDSNIEHAYWNNICDKACTFLMRSKKCKTNIVYQMDCNMPITDKNPQFKNLQSIRRLNW